MMWNSLEKLMALPDDTAVYVGHEYTQSNARFALTIEPANSDLIIRAREVDALRAAGKATLPTTIGLEKRTNPFLRVGEPAVRTCSTCRTGPAEVFGEIGPGQLQITGGLGANGRGARRPRRAHRRSRPKANLKNRQDRHLKR
jgi:hypothetical protein